MKIAIVNKSTLVPSGHLPPIVDALQVQMRRHAAPAWAMQPATIVQAVNGKTMTGSSPIVLLDDADQADALGYHDETPDGVPYGRVFVRPVFESGGDLCKSANSVSVTLSHEMLEMWADPACNRWCDADDGREYALELCDAVEGDAYAVKSIMVSNFLLPAYFDPRGFPPFDYMQRLDGPSPAMTPGGYAIYREAGNPDTIMGHGRDYLEKPKYHPAARSWRRLGGNVW